MSQDNDNPEKTPHLWANSGEPLSWQGLAMCSTPESRDLIPYDLAAKLQALPLGSANGKLLVAAPKERAAELKQELRFVIERDVVIVPVDRDILPRALFAAYHREEKQIAAAATRLPAKVRRGEFSELSLELPESPECSLLSALIKYAISRNASDLHLIPTRSGGEVRLRVDGELYSHTGNLCSVGSFQQIISRLKILAKLDIAKHSVPQDGSFRIPVGLDSINARLSILPIIHGEKAVLRFVGQRELIDLVGLGLPAEILSFLYRFLECEEGMALFTGPTGSGKTTTMYAALEFLRDKNFSLASIENPVEIPLPGISQTEISEERGFGYAEALRSMLRQDPDVILLGEIRDEVSARIAIQAAQTGHLLLSTVHSSDVLGVFERLKLLGQDPRSIARSLKLVVAQRLVPAACQFCSGGSRGTGCGQCGFSGFNGRELLAEALWISDDQARTIESSGSVLLNSSADTDYVPFRSKR